MGGLYDALQVSDCTLYGLSRCDLSKLFSGPKRAAVGDLGRTIVAAAHPFPLSPFNRLALKFS